MFDFQQMYRVKLRTPEAAVECVKDGDWVDYTSSLGKPVLLDRALAKRRESPACDEILPFAVSDATVVGIELLQFVVSAMRENAIIYRWCSTTMRLIMSISFM